MKRRIFITGYGATSILDQVSPRGDFLAQLFSADACWPATLSTIRRVHDGTFLPLTDDRQFRRADRFSKMALAASQKALDSAGFAVTPWNQDRTGMIFNTCFGPLQTTETYMQKFIENGARLAPPALFPYTVLNAFTGLVAIATKAVGSNSTICGASSLCYGIDVMRQNKDDAMLVGGCEELTHSIIGRFTDCSQNGCVAERPDDMVLGEGAAMLLLESQESTKTRKRVPLAEVLDYGSTNAINYSRGPYAIDSSVIERAMWQAIERSQVSPDEIGLFATAANGTPGLAEAEDHAFSRVFGHRAEMARIDTKKVLGETFGASEAFSLIAAACLLASKDQPQSSSAPVRGKRLAMVNCYEFGGNVDSIILQRGEA